MYQKLQWNRQKMANLPPPSQQHPICSFRGSVKNWLLIWNALSSHCKSTPWLHQLPSVPQTIPQIHKINKKKNLCWTLQQWLKIFPEKFRYPVISLVPKNTWGSVLGKEARIDGMGRNRAADLPQRKQGWKKLGCCGLAELLNISSVKVQLSHLNSCDWEAVLAPSPTMNSDLGLTLAHEITSWIHSSH